jgi:hypothetical protein
MIRKNPQNCCLWSSEMLRHFLEQSFLKMTTKHKKTLSFDEEQHHVSYQINVTMEWLDIKERSLKAR